MRDKVPYGHSITKITRKKNTHTKNLSITRLNRWHTSLVTPKVGQSRAWLNLANHGHKAHHMNTFDSLKISFLPKIAKWAFRQNTFWPLRPWKIGQGRPFSKSPQSRIWSTLPAEMTVPRPFLKNLERVRANRPLPVMWPWPWPQVKDEHMTH